MEISNIHALSAREPKSAREPGNENCRVLQAIGAALAIFDAIGQGGLFDTMPDEDAARARFRTGMTLLDLMERQLREVTEDSEHLTPKECGCGDGNAVNNLSR